MSIFRSIANKFAILLTFLLCALSLQGIVNIGNSILLLFGVWLIVVLMVYKNICFILFKQRRFVFLLFFLIFYFLCSLIALPFTTSVNRIVAFLCAFSPILMYEIFKVQSRTVLILFIFLISTIYLVNFYLSYQFQQYVGVSSLKNFAEYGEEFYVVKMGYNICHSLAFILPVCFDMVLEPHRGKFYRFSLFIIIAIIFAFLVNAQFMTALIVSLLGIIVSIIRRYKRKAIIVVLGTSFIGVLLYNSTISGIIQTLYDNDFKDIAIRLKSIDDNIKGKGDEDSSFNARHTLNMMSVETFLSNPIIGVYYRFDPNADPNDQGLGNHSTWYDSFADYGIFFFFLLYFLYDSVKRQMRDSGSYVILSVFIFLGFFNKFFLFPQLFAAYFFSPLLYCLPRGIHLKQTNNIILNY